MKKQLLAVLFICLCNLMYGQTYIFEAECASFGSAWEIVQSTVSSNGEYLETSGQTIWESWIKDKHKFWVEVNINNAGSYYVWIRLRASGGYNSIWQDIGGNWEKKDLANSGTFGWHEMSSVWLSNGTNQLVFAKREGADIDKIIISSSSGFQPSGFGNGASNCGPSNTPPVISNISNRTDSIGIAIVQSVNATDSDGDVLSYSAQGLPNGLAINTISGNIIGIPEQIGDYGVTVSVSDGVESVSTSFIWSIIDTMPDPPPPFRVVMDTINITDSSAFILFSLLNPETDYHAVINGEYIGSFKTRPDTTIQDTTPINEDIIWSVDFNNQQNGQYSRDTLDKYWNSPTWRTGVGNNRVFVENGELKVLHLQGSSGSSSTKGGAQWPFRLGQSYDELWFQYRFKFEAGYDFTDGGKLPGLIGGARPDGGVVSGGYQPTGADGFSARYMWYQDKLILYLYHPNQSGTYADNIYLGETVSANTWVTVTQYFKINTPGVPDGHCRIWVNGVEKYANTSLLLRTVGSWALDGVYFSNFHGGSGSTWEPNHNQYMYFDDFKISTTPLIE